MNPDAKEALQRATQAFHKSFGPAPPRQLWRCFVPGRIEVLGKHTDYAGGRSLLAATEQGVAVVSALNGTDRVRLANADPRFPNDSFPLTRDQPCRGGCWTNYPMTVVRRLQRNFGMETPLRGLDLAFASNLPPASGMSSSSSIVVGSFLAIAGPNDLAQRTVYRDQICTREDLATYIACIENGSPFGTLRGDQGVGTFGGSEDHTAILCCQPSRLAVYSFCPTRFEHGVPFPDHLLFVVCHSGVFAEKTGPALEKYNAVSARARQACAAYNAHYGTDHPTLNAIVRAQIARSEPGSAVFETFQAVPGAQKESGQWGERFRQFYMESHRIIPRACKALAAGDLDQFGVLVDQSHNLSRDCLWNMVPETDWLQQSARNLGACAASGFGAGFGGSVYAIVPESRSDAFQAQWRTSYLEQFPERDGAALWITTKPASAAQCWSPEPSAPGRMAGDLTGLVFQPSG